MDHIHQPAPCFSRWPLINKHQWPRMTASRTHRRHHSIGLLFRLYGQWCEQATRPAAAWPLPRQSITATLKASKEQRGLLAAGPCALIPFTTGHSYCES
ncbi:hypothetical protein B0T21DRAFT_393731 [Apiosordaria backusii]|uniref:Uncharacterized protein n=1 Tax=Apiosordaria backusii TaxID=314023 RepID=A0AA40BK82_9PEZI|nr:hypothetical protein B0T21DRAFT_393731 [Apiosordaria backusii]